MIILSNCLQLENFKKAPNENCTISKNIDIRCNWNLYHECAYCKKALDTYKNIPNITICCGNAFCWNCQSQHFPSCPITNEDDEPCEVKIDYLNNFYLPHKKNFSNTSNASFDLFKGKDIYSYLNRIIILC